MSFKGYKIKNKNKNNKNKKNVLTYTLMVFVNKNLSKYEVKLYKHSKKMTNYLVCIIELK
jgi:hypothetical protein